MMHDRTHSFGSVCVILYVDMVMILGLWLVPFKSLIGHCRSWNYQWFCKKACKVSCQDWADLENFQIEALMWSIPRDGLRWNVLCWEHPLNVWRLWLMWLFVLCLIMQMLVSFYYFIVVVLFSITSNGKPKNDACRIRVDNFLLTKFPESVNLERCTMSSFSIVHHPTALPWDDGSIVYCDMQRMISWLKSLL